MNIHKMSDRNVFVIDCCGSEELALQYGSLSPKPGDSGVDLFCPHDLVIPPNSLGTTIDFEIICCRQLANGDYGSYYLYPRSSISKTPLRLSNSVGIIDAGYRGHIMAKVDNLSNEAFSIKAGDRLFQICMPDLKGPIIVVGSVEKNTERGSGGFGSTGR